jgi:hypothetical protein
MKQLRFGLSLVGDAATYSRPSFPGTFHPPLAYPHPGWTYPYSEVKMNRIVRRILPAISALLFTAAFAALPARASDDGHFDRTLSVSGPVDLDVQTGSGNIRVHPGDSTKVEVHAAIRASWHAGGDVEARIKDIESNPPIEQNGNSIRIGHELDRDRERNISISYDVTVPAQTKLHASSGSGDVSAEGVNGPADANSGSGSIDLTNIGSDSSARTGSGDINLKMIHGATKATSGSGTIRAIGIGGAMTASTGSGDIRIEQNASGDVDVETGSGSVEIHGVKGGVHATSGSGNVSAEGNPTGEWRMRTASGDVSVRFPKEAAFELAAHTGSGSINSAHEMTVQGKISPHELHGKVNGGGVLVDLSTSSGSIEIL